MPHDVFLIILLLRRSQVFCADSACIMHIQKILHLGEEDSAAEVLSSIPFLRLLRQQPSVQDCLSGHCRQQFSMAGSYGQESSGHAEHQHFLLLFR